MIDTLRLILFLECNLRCSHCCNEQTQFNSQFKSVRFRYIQWGRYKKLCISGGEPFLNKDLLYFTLQAAPPRLDIFLYTNGLLITDEDIDRLIKIPNLKCLNVGVHTLQQLKSINPNLEQRLPVRFMVQDINVGALLELYPTRVNLSNLRGWKMNECNMPNKEWLVLEKDA
jgi:molybdenum cofactor biosynthesis enzyme MoaA